MITKRTLANVATFVLVSLALGYMGVTRFLLPPREGRTLIMTAADASGLLPRSDVTVRGVPAGSVTDVRLTDEGNARVRIILDPEVTVSRDTVAEITRRSPIGDITVNLIPGDGPPMPDGGRIPVENTIPPPDPERTIEVLAQVLNAVPPDHLDTLVTELAIALRGRGSDLATLSEAGADLPERILEVRAELESLLRTGPDVLEVLAENAPTLADDITQTALLADILRDRRYDLVDLSRNGARFAEVFGHLLGTEKANLSCLLADFGRVNEVLARPKNLRNLRAALELNHFFFGGADQAVQPSNDGLNWFRVHFLTPQGEGRQNIPPRGRPDAFGADACRSRYGPGVSAPVQDHAPYVAPGSEFHRGRRP